MGDSRTSYTREEVFQIPWTSFRTKKGMKVHQLHLEKVRLMYRIFEKGEGVFETWTRYAEEPPWKLGVHASLQEAQWHVYDGILYFDLYLTGKSGK